MKDVVGERRAAAAGSLISPCECKAVIALIAKRAATTAG